MKENQVGFMLRKIATSQFAIIENVFVENEPIELNANIKFGINEQYKIIACITRFELTINKLSFLILEVNCEFEIEEHSWRGFINKEKNQITIPVGFMSHIAVITVGTSRGVLHAKTENTKFNKYFLPTLNVSDFVKQDISFPLNIKVT